MIVRLGRRIEVFLFSFFFPTFVVAYLTFWVLSYFSFRGSNKIVEVDKRTQRAIDRGLRYLALRQEADGCWMDKVGKKVNNLYLGKYGKHVGVTALAGMSFLAGGNVPGRGKYGKQVEAVVNFFIKNFGDRRKSPNGFISLNGSRMYSHAFATLFLAEVYGMSPRAEVKRILERAVELIEKSQVIYRRRVDGREVEFGAWRYLPTSKDSDISITVCQLMALRGAKNAGITVDIEVIRRAIRYVVASYISYPTTSYRRVVYKGFWYQKFENQPSRTSFALTAAGVASLFAASEGRGLIEEGDPYVTKESIKEAIEGGLSYMLQRRNQPRPWQMRHTFEYFYAHYYAAQAMFQAGERFGRNYWLDWYKWVSREIVEGQRDYYDERGRLIADVGYWQDLVGPNYATAMATLILQIPYRYLPIFER